MIYSLSASFHLKYPKRPLSKTISIRNSAGDWDDKEDQKEKAYDAKSLWEDLIEGHKILNSTNNLNSFQSRPDDKASEHELKLQINTSGTDVGKNFFPQHRQS